MTLHAQNINRIPSPSRASDPVVIPLRLPGTFQQDQLPNLFGSPFTQQRFPFSVPTENDLNHTTVRQQTNYPIVKKAFPVSTTTSNFGIGSNLGHQREATSIAISPVHSNHNSNQNSLQNFNSKADFDQADSDGFTTVQRKGRKNKIRNSISGYKTDTEIQNDIPIPEANSNSKKIQSKFNSRSTSKDKVCESESTEGTPNRTRKENNKAMQKKEDAKKEIKETSKTNGTSNKRKVPAPPPVALQQMIERQKQQEMDNAVQFEAPKVQGGKNKRKLKNKGNLTPNNDMPQILETATKMLAHDGANESERRECEVKGDKVMRKESEVSEKETKEIECEAKEVKMKEKKSEVTEVNIKEKGSKVTELKMKDKVIEANEVKMKDRDNEVNRLETSKIEKNDEIYEIKKTEKENDRNGRKRKEEVNDEIVKKLICIDKEPEKNKEEVIEDKEKRIEETKEDNNKLNDKMEEVKINNTIKNKGKEVNKSELSKEMHESKENRIEKNSKLNKNHDINDKNERNECEEKINEIIKQNEGETHKKESSKEEGENKKNGKEKKSKRSKKPKENEFNNKEEKSVNEMKREVRENEKQNKGENEVNELEKEKKGFSEEKERIINTEVGDKLESNKMNDEHEKEIMKETGLQEEKVIQSVISKEKYGENTNKNVKTVLYDGNNKFVVSDTEEIGTKIDKETEKSIEPKSDDTNINAEYTNGDNQKSKNKTKIRNINFDSDDNKKSDAVSGMDGPQEESICNDKAQHATKKVAKNALLKPICSSYASNSADGTENTNQLSYHNGVAEDREGQSATGRRDDIATVQRDNAELSKNNELRGRPIVEGLLNTDYQSKGELTDEKKFSSNGREEGKASKNVNFQKVKENAEGNYHQKENEQRGKKTEDKENTAPENEAISDVKTTSVTSVTNGFTADFKCRYKQKDGPNEPISQSSTSIKENKQAVDDQVYSTSQSIEQIYERPSTSSQANSNAESNFCHHSLGAKGEQKYVDKSKGCSSSATLDVTSSGHRVNGSGDSGPSGENQSENQIKLTGGKLKDCGDHFESDFESYNSGNYSSEEEPTIIENIPVSIQAKIGTEIENHVDEVLNSTIYSKKLNKVEKESESPKSSSQEFNQVSVDSEKDSLECDSFEKKFESVFDSEDKLGNLHRADSVNCVSEFESSSGKTEVEQMENEIPQVTVRLRKRPSQPEDDNSQQDRTNSVRRRRTSEQHSEEQPLKFSFTRRRQNPNPEVGGPTETENLNPEKAETLTGSATATNHNTSRRRRPVGGQEHSIDDQDTNREIRRRRRPDPSKEITNNSPPKSNETSIEITRQRRRRRDESNTSEATDNKTENRDSLTHTRRRRRRPHTTQDEVIQDKDNAEEPILGSVRRRRTVHEKVEGENEDASIENESARENEYKLKENDGGDEGDCDNFVNKGKETKRRRRRPRAYEGESDDPDTDATHHYGDEGEVGSIL